MQELHSALSAGQRVVVRDERWTVLYSEEFESGRVLKLRGIDGGNYNELRTVLAPFDVVSPDAAGRVVRQRSRRTVLRCIAHSVASSLPWDEAWTAARARIDLHAWQLEPAMAAVTGTMRILLADGVGLGKTIQAGLIVAELFARGLAERALVLTPASLREQWANELERLGLRAAVFDQAAIAAAAAQLPPDVNPWKSRPLIISSLDLVKRMEVRAAVEVTPFDVLVVDEAHHLTPGSDRGAVVSALAARVPWVVLCTATPHSGDAHAYDYLTRLGDVAGEPLQIFRRMTRPSDGRRRRSRLLLVHPSAAERALLEATRGYAATLKRHAAHPGARLVGALIARRAASSALAAASTVTRRLALLASSAAPDAQPPLPWTESDDDEDDVDERMLSGVGLTDVASERTLLQHLQTLAKAASPRSSKVAVIRRLLRRTTEQAIVFSEYRDVVLEVAEALGDMTAVATLHGGMLQQQRRAVVAAFNRGAVRVLVATDAAGEGLNLHARCRLIVNIELPWTPLRLEQRIGRVDRIGQTRRVHAIHLAHRDSYEGTVIARLERRRARANTPFDETLENGGSLVAQARRLHELARNVHAVRDIVYAPRGPRTEYAALMLAFTVPLLDAGGRTFERRTVVLTARSPRPAVSRALVRLLARDDGVRAFVARSCLATLSERQLLARASGDGIAARLMRVVSALQDARRAEPWQGSLFDRRHEQQAHLLAAQQLELVTQLNRRCRMARDLQEIHLGEPALFAAWPGHA
jgi:superfamily II DNA or RNA helicase